jgi:hypothetical protein
MSRERFLRLLDAAEYLAAHTIRATTDSTASWSRTSTSIPKAVPPDASISATVLSPVISLASASKSSYEHRFRSATATFAPNPASRFA